MENRCKKTKCCTLERERERGIQPNLILKQVFGDNNMYDVLSFLFFANNKKKVNSFITEGIILW